MLASRLTSCSGSAMNTPTSTSWSTISGVPKSSRVATDGTTEYNASHYRISVFYDLAKVAVNRLAFSQGHELAVHGATAVAITPGWLRSEMMLDNFRVAEDNWRDALDPGRARTGQPLAPADFLLAEPPRYLRRGAPALAADAD